MLSRDDRNRPQDLLDLRALLRVASTSDLDEARDVILLIETRGYARRRNLSRDFATLLSKRD